MIITRKIEIDMGHRIPNHLSKCKNPHGHRYMIELGVDGGIIDLQGDSEQGMVKDFGVLKQLMIQEIDTVCDHGFMLYKEDIEMLNAFYIGGRECMDLIEQEIEQYGYANAYGAQKNKEGPLNIIIVPFIPTAENIAKWFYERLKLNLDKVGINISYVRVFETPNCSAIYNGEPKPQGVRLG